MAKGTGVINIEESARGEASGEEALEEEAAGVAREEELVRRREGRLVARRHPRREGGAVPAANDGLANAPLAVPREQRELLALTAVLHRLAAQHLAGRERAPVLGDGVHVHAVVKRQRGIDTVFAIFSDVHEPLGRAGVGCVEGEAEAKRNVARLLRRHLEPPSGRDGQSDRAEQPAELIADAARLLRPLDMHQPPRAGELRAGGVRVEERGDGRADASGWSGCHDACFTVNVCVRRTGTHAWTRHSKVRGPRA
eukprot:1600942-Prymnesium_polylepis.1